MRYNWTSSPGRFSLAREKGPGDEFGCNYSYTPTYGDSFVETWKSPHILPSPHFSGVCSYLSTHK